MIMTFPIFDARFHRRPEAAVRSYLQDGAHSARLLTDILYDRMGFNREMPFKLLELASGYGRVTRHWPHFTNAQVTACDIHPEVVRFLREELGTAAVQSSTDPEALSLPEQYQVIFCLSFFSHMPERTWARWLGRLYHSLAPGGVLVITANGKTCAMARNITVEPTSLYFVPQTEQHDLDLADYGYTIVGSRFVQQQVSKLPGARLEAMLPDYYWTVQDAYVIRKTIEA
jgi:SAM-dependent methyltransferase